MVPFSGLNIMPLAQAAAATSPTYLPQNHEYSGLSKNRSVYDSQQAPTAPFPCIWPWALRGRDGQIGRQTETQFQLAPVWLDEFLKERRGGGINFWAIWERQRQLGPTTRSSGFLSGNRPAEHPATTLSAYIMSQVQYSRGRLFKEHKSERADKKVINLVAKAQHESFSWSYIGHRQTPGLDLGNVAGIFRLADNLWYLHEVQKSHSPYGCVLYHSPRNIRELTGLS